ncbi:MAG: helix-turn-helix domain-containing protein [Acidobacteriota bacterium]
MFFKMDNFNKQIGNHIKKTRESLGITQMELAEKIGVTYQQVQKYEKGRSNISIKRLHEIAKALNVPVAFLLEKIPVVGEEKIKYRTSGKFSFFLDKNEISLLKLFRKIRDENIKKGIIQLLKGVIRSNK